MATIYHNSTAIVDYVLSQLLGMSTMAVAILSTPWQPLVEKLRGPRSYRIVGYRDIPPQKKLLPGTEENRPCHRPFVYHSLWFMIMHHGFS